MDDYMRKMMNLKTLVTWTLEKKGILAKIRVELRASVFEEEDQVIEKDEDFDDINNIYSSSEDFKSMNQRDHEKRLHLLEYFVNRCHEVGGDPNEVIYHLLVVGFRGLGPFQRVIPKTVSKFCTKHAKYPVIAIKRKPGETPQDPVYD